MTSPSAADRSCTVQGCEKPCHARGLCRMHHTRVLRYGDVEAVRPRPQRQAGAIFCPSDDLCERRRNMDDWCPTMKAHALAVIARRAELVDPPSGDPLAREVVGQCWIVGTPAAKGYRAISIGLLNRRAHRVTLAASGSRIAGTFGDHLCRNRACCNPAHLEPTTVAENTSRGSNFVAVNVRRTHCIHGHQFTPENTLGRGKRAGRDCRTCKAERARKASAEKRANR